MLYASKSAWRNDIPGRHNKIIDEPDFWDNAINLKLYNKKIKCQQKQPDNSVTYESGSFNPNT